MPECNNCSMECNSHFKNLRPSVSGYKVSKHFAKEVDNSEEIIRKILACENMCFAELHKFEEKIGAFSVFRAKINGVHIVYAIGPEGTALFLRAFKNFSIYGKFLEDKRAILKSIEQIN